LASQQARIGRLDLEFIRPDRSLARNWERVRNVHDASYLLVFRLAGGVTFSQDGVPVSARSGEYVLLSELAFYELSPGQEYPAAHDAYPAAELRGRLVSIEDHVSRRFKPNEQMTHPAGGNDQKRCGTVHQFSATQSPGARDRIVSFIALTIGSEDRAAATDVRNARYHLRRRIVDFSSKPI